MYNCRKAIQEYEQKIRHQSYALLFLIVSIYRSLLNSTPLSNIRVAYTGVLLEA